MSANGSREYFLSNKPKIISLMNKLITLDNFIALYDLREKRNFDSDEMIIQYYTEKYELQLKNFITQFKLENMLPSHLFFINMLSGLSTEIFTLRSYKFKQIAKCSTKEALKSYCQKLPFEAVKKEMVILIKHFCTLLMQTKEIHKERHDFLKVKSIDIRVKGILTSITNFRIQSLGNEPVVIYSDNCYSILTANSQRVQIYRID